MISLKDIGHIAKLARLDLSDKEKQKYSKELSEILDYMEKLNEVDTKNIEPTSQVTGLTNVFRKDERPTEIPGFAREPSPSQEVDVEKIKKIIGQAPEREGNFVKTKPILGK